MDILIALLAGAAAGVALMLPWSVLLPLRSVVREITVERSAPGVVTITTRSRRGRWLRTTTALDMPPPEAARLAAALTADGLGTAAGPCRIALPDGEEAQ